MAEKILENHKIVTTEHEMRIDGHYLGEKKQKSLIESDDGTGTTTILVHVRTIDNRSYKVVEEKKGQDDPERTIDTEMNEEEITIFLEEWDKLWTPRISDEQIVTLGKQ